MPRSFPHSLPALLMSVVLPAIMPLTVLAQGVPVIDQGQLLVERLRAGVETELTAQHGQTNNERTTQADLHKAQIEQLEYMLNELSGPGFGSGALEDMTGFEAANVYAIEDNNPHADRLFGDARVTIEQMIIETAQNYAGHPALARAGINPTEFRIWFQSLIKQESGFSIGARSPAAAYGLTQIIPGTAKELGIFPEYYENPRLQLDGGARYFLQQLNRFGTVPLALAAYNAGPGAVQKYGGIPPYRETQNYVVKISGYYNAYAAKITGVDSVGTLTASEMSIAELSNIADAGMSYAGHSTLLLTQSLTRLRGILEQIPQASTTRQAMDLNTYARAEVTRIGAVLTRLQAAQRKIEATRYASLWAAYARDEGFLHLNTEN